MLLSAVALSVALATLRNSLRNSTRKPSLCDRRAWRMPDWYVASCWNYSIVGIVLLQNLRLMRQIMPYVPWHSYAIALVLNGFTSFMSDVVAFGREDVWHSLDVVVALCNTAFTICVGQHAHRDACMKEFGQVLVLLAIASLVCFVFATRCAQACNERGYFAWHALWHSVLPLGGAMLVMYVVNCTVTHANGEM